MKKIILLLTICMNLLSCSNDSNNSSSNNGNSFTNSMDYEFTITINGEVHKVKGNTTNGIPYGSVMGSPLNYINNKCYAMNGPGYVIANLGINDLTATNYISGQNLTCQIQLPNLLLGTNQATIYFGGSYLQTLAENLGAPAFSGAMTFQTTSGDYRPSDMCKLAINITDLGTGYTTNSLGKSNFGQTLKGNYSGTVYLANGYVKFTIPLQLSIDFKVLRMY